MIWCVENEHCWHEEWAPQYRPSVHGPHEPFDSRSFTQTLAIQAVYIPSVHIKDVCCYCGKQRMVGEKNEN